MSAPETIVEPKHGPELAYSDALPETQYPEALFAVTQERISGTDTSRGELQTDELSSHAMSPTPSPPEMSAAIPPGIATADPPAPIYFHPEISAKIQREDKSAFVPLATASDAPLPTYSHPEVSAEMRPQEASAVAPFATVSQEEMVGNDEKMQRLPTFSHPEISEEIPSHASSANASQSEGSAEVPSQSPVKDVSPSSFTHPEISEGLRPGESSTGVVPATESEIITSVDPRPELIVEDPISAAFSHPEIFQGIAQTDSSVTVAAASVTSTPPFETSAEVPSYTAVVDTTPAIVSKEVLPGAAGGAPGAVVETWSESEEFPEVRIEISRDDKKAIIDALSRKTLSQDTMFEPGSQDERKYVSEIAAPRKTITDHTKDAEALTEAEREALKDFAARRTMIQPNIALSPFQQPAGIAPSETGSVSEEIHELRNDISGDDRKAIIDALSRKTLSQDAIFQPIFQGERKYVSETAAPRKTITDHTKDAEAITSAEREALKDSATRRTVIQPDIALSLFQQPVDIPVQYTNPTTNQMTDIEKAAYAAVAKAEGKLSFNLKAPKLETRLEICEEVPRAEEDGEVQTDISTEERNAATNARSMRKVSKDASMEVIPEDQVKTVSKTLTKKAASLHSEDYPALDPGGDKKADEIPGFSIDPPLMPFSKKERRELVRHISMRIIEPEAPLWDMDLADIKEAEEAEKNRNTAPDTFDPTFDFDAPIKPKAPVRRSKRHRIVRVHATDYGRAQAVESQEFCSNKIKSTKYTLMTFLPLNLFLQCSRAANLYFILIAALQLIPDFSPTNWSTTVVPLCFVLFFNALKEAVDDIKRGISDRTINKQKVEVLNENSFFVTNWSSVIVGDIVRVKNDQEFPADLVFLSSADVKGLAYVETANLDGETNLKIRNAFYKGSSKAEQDETSYSIFSSLTVECELPNNRLYKFEGAINLQDYGKLPLDTPQVLLRGATLRNTEWILGVVVYTGADAKFVRNMIPEQVKVTGLERNMNILVAIVFVCQVAICIGLAAANDQWTRDDGNYSPYIPEFQEMTNAIGPKPHTIGAQFGRFLILLNQLIPISLYVTLEIVKVAQSYLIDWDVHMYHRDTQTHAKARTTSLNEELGQVQYVMADKTGTLTQNIMAFVQCSVGGVVYGTIQHEGGFQVGELKDTIHTLSNDPKLIQKLKEVAAGSEDTDSLFLDAFFHHLAICHVVHPAFAKKGEEKEGIAEDTVVKYTGASPDEEALVQGAADCGYQLKKRADDELSVFVPGLGLQRFVIMAVLEFTSERKRMSIICRDSKGRIKLYCKGADSVIFKRLARGQEELVETSLNQLEDFARCGYRTMCMAERQISGSEYEKWAARFRAASIALDDRDEKLAAVSETIERDLMLLGVTAVEDKLQSKVPETITLLAQAGIKVWVLTGDKLETSVSVALSCNLLADSMHLFLLSENVSKSVPQLLRSMLDEARRQHKSKLKMEGSEYQSEMATAIEGSSLTVALEETNKLLFLELLKLCRSVVCCRVSPIQKAQVTTLLKDHGNAVILAIGDGANDCGMIKAAQIGVGIGGREGMAAVLASDYSITRFRYLRRLLLVHGRWSYIRNRELVMYALYKNIVYCLGNAYLAFYSGFSSPALFSSVEIATYNLIWTSLPTIAFAVLNKDMSDCTAENNPQLYTESQLERRPQFFWCLTGWALSAFWDSLIAFFLPLAAAFTSGKFGETLDIWELGSTIYTMAVFIVNAKIISRMHNLTWFHFAALNISTWLWLLVFFCLSFSWQLSGLFANLAGIGEVVTQRSFFWLLLVLCPVVSSLPYCTFEIFRNQHAPADFEVMREIEHGWTDGYFFPDAPDYVEQIIAPIPELRRASLEFEDDYGPSPLQKEIADAREALQKEGGGLSNTSGILGSTDSTEAGGPVTIQPAKEKDDKQLRPRRLTWREVVNDDELEDLATSTSLGRDGRRKSSGFRVVTRHTDSAEAPVVPLAQGPKPPQRKSVMFDQNAPLLKGAPTTVAARRASLKPAVAQQEQQKKHKDDKHLERKPKAPLKPKKAQDSRLKAVRENLKKHAEERKTLAAGPAKRTTKKGQKLWAAVKEGSAERDPYARRDSTHPLQKMLPPGSTGRSTTTATRTSTAKSPRAGSPVPHSPREFSKHGKKAPSSRFDPNAKLHSQTAKTGATSSSTATPRPPKLHQSTPGLKLHGDLKDPEAGPSHPG